MQSKHQPGYVRNIVQIQSVCKRTKARGELAESEVSIAVRIQSIEYVLQLIRAERELAIQPLFDKT